MTLSVKTVKGEFDRAIRFIDRAEACLQAIESIPFALEDLKAEYARKPDAIEDCFRRGRRLGCYPCSLDNDSFFEFELREPERAASAQHEIQEFAADRFSKWGLESPVLDDALSGLWQIYSAMADSERESIEPFHYESDYIEFLRSHSAKTVGQRYLAFDHRENCVLALTTMHEFAFWWHWKFGRFLHYCWSGPLGTGESWWDMEPLEFIEEVKQNAKQASDFMAHVANVPYLREIIQNEKTAMFSTLESSGWQARPVRSGHEWLTVRKPDVELPEFFGVEDTWNDWPVVSLDLPTVVEDLTDGLCPDNGRQPGFDRKHTEPLPKSFLQHYFECTDKTLGSRMASKGVEIHPEDALPNRKHKLRLVTDSLINEQIYLPANRSAELESWKQSKAKKG